MNTILDEIVATKHRELAAARPRVPESELENRATKAPAPRDFLGALQRPPGVQFICEVKKASPSAGVLRADFDPVAIARTYAAHGAACLSVLTDEQYFQGSLDYLRAIRAAVPIPVVRKDFLIDRYQILEARAAGADAILLIAEILTDDALRSLLREATHLGMAALVELHDAANLQRVIDAGAILIGINNRDLRTFVTRLEHTLELAARLPKGTCLVSESGIRSPADIARLQAAGVKAVLVGESLMRAADIGAKLDELRGQH